MCQSNAVITGLLCIRYKTLQSDTCIYRYCVDANSYYLEYVRFSKKLLCPRDRYLGDRLKIIRNVNMVFSCDLETF